jgi:hypothetical protein
MELKHVATLLGLALGAALQWTNGQEVLPRLEAPFGGYIARKVQDSIKDFPKEVRAPKGAPNILLILTDDVGFARQEVPFKFTGTLNKVIITLGGAELSAADQRAIDEAEGQEAASD